MRIAALAWWLLAGSVSCEGSSEPVPLAVGSVSIQTTPQGLGVVDSVTVRVENTGATQILFNECPTFIDQHVSGQWVTLNTNGWFEGVACELILRVLPVGSEFVYRIPVVQRPTGTTYRLRLVNFWDGENFRRGPQLDIAALVSNSFVLR